MKTNTQNQKIVKAQSQIEQLGTEKRGQINYGKRNANRLLETEKLLALLRRETPRFFELAEVVRKWLWIQFRDKQPNEVTRVLAELGFHWNYARQIWQHPCGSIRKEKAPFDPRFSVISAPDTTPFFRTQHIA